MPDHHRILDGLDPEQQRAVLAPRGPVCVLAGAGTGKTRTITRRIAHLIDSGQVNPSQVLAVTFTTRAAGELRSRLRALGIAGPGGSVQAQTFHAAALRQLRYFWPRELSWELLDNKLPVVARAARHAGLATTSESLRDLASEIEWAKASLIGPAGYPEAVAALRRDTPFPADAVADVFDTYERAKRDGAHLLLDFDDLIVYAAELLREPRVAADFRSRYRCFVVDEYQDITPVQQGLLEAWLGERDNLTVVGDANQTIYTFAGATSRFLLDFTRRYPDAILVRLERDYRSTPEVVAVANQVIAGAGERVPGTRLELVGQRSRGPVPRPAEFADELREAHGVAAQIKHLINAGTPPSEIAVLYRVNAQSDRFEEALTEAGIPYQIRGSEAFFTRTEIVQAMGKLRAAAQRDDLPAGVAPAHLVRAVLAPLGLSESEPAGANAKARWESLSALMSVVSEMVADQPGLTFPRVVAELTMRAEERHTPTQAGVTLASLHAAKGLEWDAVFLVGLTEGSVPISQAIDAGPSAIDEERRLFYVGITRAREHLFLSWSLSRSGSSRATRKRTRFLEGIDLDPRRSGRCTVCGAQLVNPESRVRQRCGSCRVEERDEALVSALRSWRADHARRRGMAEHAVLTDAMLDAIAERRPADTRSLGDIGGIGPTKLDQFGAELLDLVKSAGQK
ncbi:ATP-dependent DNA helicase UvrD2 [Gordonia rhizosphera]|uniref:DNA 3'-5' helicase n=1 Tax=Gordonia rhizosphera NBRC 16068 TaxID=1108045 RepID=K6W8N8_9ACTN|nr:ATP-dependent DNA helicase UvrD2 [Gordonia rhizosphera]GAB88587.1 ATP-dependent DNA helicase UvrD2 [Gordonia rhizosphera NBRC 16068]